MTKKELLCETSKIRWHELQRFFASGVVIVAKPDLDVIDVAYQISKDNKAQMEKWLAEKKVSKVSDEQALKWYEENTTVWAVVVKPWVLVQEIHHE